MLRKIMFMMHNARLMFALALLAVTALGCDKQMPFYNNLDEQRSNKVLAVLMQAGIGCGKSAGEEGMWNLTVSSKHFAEAVRLVNEAGLPGEEFMGVGEVFKKTGMVSSPTEERIRFMHALAEDLSATLCEIDGVTSARVHVVLPDTTPFAKEVKPSSASVFVKYRYDVDMESRIPFIKNLVKDSIEGLNYDNISLALFKSDPPKEASLDKVPMDAFMGIAVSRDSAETLRLVVGSLAGACGALLVMVVVLAWFSVFRKSKTRAGT